jgi:DNA-binding NarL/FixJ family response regulator
VRGDPGRPGRRPASGPHGVAVLIDREDDLELVGEADDGRAALQLARRTRPDVLLLDIRMPGMDGLATLREITADPTLASTRVVIVTTFEIDQYVSEALQAGASGFILKDAEPAELLRATVRTHISRAMGKLGARDRAQLVVFAVRAGPVLPEEESIVHDRNNYPEQGSCQGVWSPDGA